MPRAVWPPYVTVRALVHRHAGKPAVILGGGPSLPDHLARAPRDAIHISVNDHGARLLKDRPELGRPLDYIVGLDRIEERLRFDNGPPELAGTRDGAAWEVPVIGKQMWADYRLTYWVDQNSGVAAAYVARLMGCTPIVILGMDLYCGGTYYDAPKAKSTGHLITDALHLRRWYSLSMMHPGPYRTLGGSPRLQALCAHYDPAEAVEPPVRTAQLLDEIRSAIVRTLKDVLIVSRPFAADTELEVSRTEAKNLIEERQAVLVDVRERA